MRHGARTQSFSRPFNQRKWLFRNLAWSLVEHERIVTTLAKAKELRRVVEKAVTLGKRGTIADRRLLMSRFPNEELVAKVFAVLAPRFSTRPGGYTRIYRISRRPGDNAEMAIIEFIDAVIKDHSVKEGSKAPKVKKEVTKEAAAARETKAAALKAKKETKAAQVLEKKSKAAVKKEAPSTKSKATAKKASKPK